MKRSIICLGLTLLSCYAYAQNATATASQHMELQMAELVNVDLTPVGGSGGSGSVVEIPFAGVNTMSEGLESQDIQVTLQGTTNFEISVQASANTFTYAGSATTNNTMQVSDVLSIIVTANNTGGNVASGFSSYQAVEGVNTKKLIDQCQPGVRSFSFKYKATPGFNYSAGTYTTNIVYTVTKI